MKIGTDCDICKKRVKKDQKKAGINLCRKHLKLKK